MFFNEKEIKIQNNTAFNNKKMKKLNFNNINKDLLNNEKEILKLKKIIAEKDNIILELHSKLKEFRKDIDLLKNKMIFISEKAQSKEIFNNEFLQIQAMQRFEFLSIYNNNDLKLNINKSLSKKENDIISMNNVKKYFNDLEYNLNNDINSNSYLNLIPYKNYNHSANNFYKNKINNNNYNYIKDIKYNSSLFFQRCKILMNNEQYLELLRIIKLYNARKISKSQAYEKITNYLEKINPELLKEFYNLFVN